MRSVARIAPLADGSNPGAESSDQSSAGAAARSSDAQLRAASQAAAIVERLRGPALAPEPPRPQPPTDLEGAGLRLSRRIRAHLSRGALDVTLTDNRYTMISVRRRRGQHYQVRLHHMFVDAEPAMMKALARYIAKNDRQASRQIGDYIDQNQHCVRPRVERRHLARLITQGEHHDLQAIFDQLNRDYFAGRIVAGITWGQRSSKPRRRNSIKMGSYAVEDRLIRIHRSLDRAFVPRFFVAWIVFHEMLHQVHQVTTVNGRRCFHCKAFLRDEARFERYEEARAWERAHLDELLTY